jgi:serine/threonine-protein kinase
MATVFRARDASLRREVAVKVLFPHLARRDEIVKRFHREARAAAALDHPNILRVLDVGGGPEAAEPGVAGDPPFIVLELIDGESLGDRFRSGEPLIAEAAAAIGVVICRALAAAHGAGIVHRDIKPANVMLAAGGRLVIADFGVAQVEGEDSVVTRTGALLGTPAFMSPEQARGESLDARSDLYSLGATLYCLTTGAMPFTGSTAAVVSAIVAGSFVEPLRREPRIGPDMAAIIERLMAIDPASRYPDADAAAEALLEVAGLEDGAVDGLIASLQAEPEAAVLRLEAEAVAAAMAAAERAAAEGRAARAIALADRVLAFDPEHREALAVIEGLSRRGRRGWWLAAAAAGAAAIAALLWQLGSFGGGSELVAAAPESAVDVGLRDAAPATLAPADAAPAVASVRDAAAAPVAPPAAADRERRPAVRPAAAVAARERPDAAVRAADAAVAAAEPAIRSPIDLAPPPTGTVVVSFPGACADVSVAGKSYGSGARRKSLEGVPAGRHTVRCRQVDGTVHTAPVTVKGGETSRVSLSGEVTVVVAVGAQVKYRGRRYGNGESIAVTPSDAARFEIQQPDGRWKPLYVKVRGRCTLRGGSCR